MALRVARRDARRYKWRSALIVAMVGIPVLLLTSGIALMATQDISPAESVPRVMGSAQARIHAGGPGPIVQSPDGQNTRSASPGTDAEPGAQPAPGLTAATVQKLTGGRAIPMSNGFLRVTLGDRRPNLAVLGIDGRDPLARGMTELSSGRWASNASEVVVTEAGIAGGLPDKGRLTTAGPDARARVLTVVGVAVAHLDGSQFPALPALVGLPVLVRTISDPSGMSVEGFLLQRTAPMTWPEVRRLNSQGLMVQSRQVFQNPPPMSDVDPQIADSMSSAQDQMDIILLLAAVGLFIETTLLAGPALAVSAARQRRSLALAASNGAESRQLRRYVLGQAVVLGVLSSALAVVSGVLLTLAGLTWWKAGHADFDMGPFEVSWPRVVGVLICSVVASVVAALLPAKGVARLDIVSVLAGRDGSRTVRAGLPAAGAAVMVLSAVAVIWGASSGASSGAGVGLGLSNLVMVGGAVGLVLGCLMVIPALLAVVGRLSTRLVLPLRLAARDTARQRGRATPAVAAIMAAVAALTAVSIGAASEVSSQQNDYTPSMAMGTGTIALSSDDVDGRRARAVLRRYAPQLVVQEVGFVGDATTTATGSHPWVTQQPPGCTDAQILATYQSPGGAGGCSRPDGEVMVHVGPLSGLPIGFHLSASQRAALTAGAILVIDPGMVQQDGLVSFVSGTANQDSDGAPTRATITGHAQLPAVLMDAKTWLLALGGENHGAWILPETAKQHGWPVRLEALRISSPTGSISTQQQSDVADRLDNGFGFEVERGYHDPSGRILLILFSVTGLLVLISSLISTALSLAEGQNDMATLAAVGATRHTRRGIAAGQALVVAACGCVLGLLVGLVPGIAITWPLTSRRLDVLTNLVSTRAPTIVIPWPALVGVCVGVPLLAGAFAWVAVRRYPQMTRRIT